MKALIAQTKRRLFAGSFTREAAILAGGTALGQIVMIVASTVLSRLYSPADYGVYAVYGAILSILLVGTSLRYEVAIPLPAEEGEARHLLLLSLLILVLTTSVVAGITVWFGASLADQLGASDLKPFLWLLPLSLLGAGTYQVLNYWAIRQKAFGAIARTKLTQSIALVVTQLGLGVVQGPLGLLVGDVVGRTMGSRVLAAQAWRNWRGSARGGTPHNISQTASAYRRFPLITTWSSLLNSISLQLPIALFSMLFGTSVAGLFSLCIRVLQAPMVLIGQAVAQVFLSRAGSARRDGAIDAMTWQIFSRLVSLSVAPFLVLTASGQDVFAFVFGATWAGAGLYAQWLAPWLLVVFVTSPLSSLVLVMDRQREELVFQASLLGGRILALLVGAHLGSAQIAVAMYGITGLGLWLLYLYWLMGLSGTETRRVTKYLGLKLIRALPLLVPLLMCRIIGVATQVNMVVLAATIAWTLWHIYREIGGSTSDGC